MSRWKKKSYDGIHNYVEKIEDVLLSESSWSTTDSECSGCIHLSREESLQSEGFSGPGLELATLPPIQTLDNSSAWNIHSNANCIHSASSHCMVAGGLRTSVGHTAAPYSSLDIRGGMLQQLSLLAAGAQPWHHNICTAHSRRFAYAATLAIYVYEAEEGSNEWQLFSILADHRKTITCLDWHPCSEDLLASAALDQRVCVWSVSRQCVLYAINICRVPTVVAWCTGHRDLLSFSTQVGPLQLWDYAENSEPFPFREDYGYPHAIVSYRWHPSVPGRLVVGHNDGKITVYREDLGKSRYSAFPDGGEDTDDHNLVTLEWDTCSPDYILVAYRGGALWLVDINTMRVITKYILPVSASISTLAWLPDAPGMFVTGDAEKGILRVWTVNKSTPVETCVLKDTGFHVLCATRVERVPVTQKIHQDLSNDLVSERKGLMVPNVAIVTLFKDGGVGLYHLRRKQWIFNREHGHTETIFDCSFKPEDSDLLATGSFDGSIKIWRIDTLEAVDTLPNCSTIIYSVSWAPADLNCIVAGTSGGDVFIWDVGKHKILQDITSHKDKKVFCVTWNQKDARRIASAGESGFCYVHQVSGTLLQDYRHPGPVYGCDWRDADVLATGCEDGRIRIFCVTKNRKDPVTELKAHAKKVFRVKWNPVYDDILCSGSDDSSVRIWSYSKAQCLNILVGHSDHVRGLVWCPEVPFLLISGSWDRTMRVWDARHAACLDVVLDHGADVYGLSIHPVRPFLLASCSRDSTMRLWSLASFVAPLYLKVLAGGPDDEIIKINEPKTFSSGLHLCGLRAHHLQAALQKTDASCQPNKKLKLFADLFCGDVRVRNLWDLVYILQGHTDISLLSPNYTQSIMHHSHIIKCSLALAAEQEMDASRGQGVAGRKHSTAESQEALAESYLRCGAVQQYCELMTRLHQWDHALALAPAVSVDYWHKLMTRHAEQLLSDDNEACVPYLLATRDADKLINFHIGRGHLDKAFAECIALSKMNQNNRKATPPEVPPRAVSAEINGFSLVQGRTVECARLVAQWHLLHGAPIIASCALLAVDDIKGALSVLLQGHELELVVAVGRLLGSEVPQGDNTDAEEINCVVETAVRYLTYRAIRLSLWDLAIELAQTLPEGVNQTILKVEVILSHTGTQQERDTLYESAKFPPPAECFDKAVGSVQDQVLYLLLSTQPQKGISRSIEFLEEQISGGNLDRSSVWYVLRLVQAVPLVHNTGKWAVPGEERGALLALSAYLGAVKAAMLKYTTIVPYLLSHASYILEKHRPAGCEFLSEHINTAKTKWEKEDCNWDIDISQDFGLWCDVGITRVSGSHLPRHSDSQTCCITNQIIKGPSYFLENGESSMGQNDALMWAKVHPYSPMGTGYRLNPF
ncbi:WD repeat-containing protein 17-like isoform X1 [Portunus trituberculatus]|uniref:WD repeat-containing protein 17-like isoform X1 n=2 Tax=Portunus trituberculatus TaxID=210409 RepID=UPI001E1CC7A1|nr:WD repeat-containing protein 17-like isoform X1 [Portunus trituberculatus]